MTKKTLFAFWAFICAIILFAGCSGSGPEDVVSKLNYRYVSAQEGQQILLSNTAYFNAHTQTDIVWKSRGKTNNIDEFTALSYSHKDGKTLAKSGSALGYLILTHEIRD